MGNCLSSPAATPGGAGSAKHVPPTAPAPLVSKNTLKLDLNNQV
jgi:hypothetical protein